MKYILAFLISFTVSFIGLTATNSKTVKSYKEIYFNQKFNDPVTEKTINTLINTIDSSEEVLTITFGTAGGSGYATRSFELYLRNSGKTYNSYVSHSTASAGALLWIMGKHRSIEPDATILFHGAHLGTYSLTQTTTCKASTFLSTEKGQSIIIDAITNGPQTTIQTNNLNFEDIKNLETSLKVIAMEGLAGVEQTMDTICTALTNANNNQVRVIAKYTGLPEYYIREFIYKNFEKDVYFTGKQLYNIGIAHRLGR